MSILAKVFFVALGGGASGFAGGLLGLTVAGFKMKLDRATGHGAIYGVSDPAGLALLQVSLLLGGLAGCFIGVGLVLWYPVRHSKREASTQRSCVSTTRIA